MTDAQQQAHARSLRDPRGFWAQAADAIEWLRRSRAVIDETRAPLVTWFPGAMLNVCSNALDLHVHSGRGEQTALIWEDPLADAPRRISYRELLEQVARLAGVLAALGVERGDRVLILLPACPEAVVGMLAAARIGAIHFMVSPHAGADELAQCLQLSAPRVALVASSAIGPAGEASGIAVFERALSMASEKPRQCVVLAPASSPAPLRPGRDVDWLTALAQAEPAACVAVEAKAPLHLLQTPAAAGTRRASVRAGGGYAVALKWGLAHVFGAAPGDVVWAAAELASGLGHAYAVYAPLLLGCTTVLASPRSAGGSDALARVIERHRVNVLLAPPAALRTIRRTRPRASALADRDGSSLRALFLVGGRADPESVCEAERALRAPVIETWWQSESGLPIAAPCAGGVARGVARGSAGRPVPGFDVRVLGDDGSELPPGANGHLVLKLPLPPGATTALWQDEDGFARRHLARFPGYYETGDAGSLAEDGQIVVSGRMDDAIGIRGRRVFPAALEEAIAAHPGVAECAAIGVRDEQFGHLPLVFVVPEFAHAPAALAAELAALVQGRLADAPVRVLVVEKLPRLRGGSVPRGLLRKIADGEPWRTPPALEDASALSALRAALALPRN